MVEIQMITKEETRDAIIQIARNIFGKYGFQKTSMNQIANANRKGKSSLYYYFNSKEDVFKAVLEQETSMLRGEILAAISEYDDPKDKLKAYIHIRMNGFKKLLNLYDAIKNEYLSHLQFIDNARKNHDESEVNTIKSILDDGVVRGFFSVPNTTDAARAIVTAMKGLEYPFFVSQDSPEIVNTQIEALLNILFYGISVR
jgi:AcrR family transcriptional regulator